MIFLLFTTLLLKQNLAISSLDFLFTFNEWPQQLDCDIKKSVNILLFT